MKIGIDLDEVLGQFLSALIEYHNNKYGTKFKEEDFHSYNFWNVWGGTKDEAIEKVYNFNRTDSFKNIEPIEGAKKAIAKIKENNELFIITSRPQDTKEDTREWLEKNFPNTFSKEYFTGDFVNNGHLKTKKEICDEIGIDVLIEDSANYANECVNPKRKVFLFNKTWNKDAKIKERVIRVNNWEEVLQRI